MIYTKGVLMHQPADPLHAATHPDPYPYYARMVDQQPFHFDDSLGLWVAAGSADVEEVLASDRCRVRPSDEPLPRSLAGTPVGEIYRHLIRMTDGPAQARRKEASVRTLGALSDDAMTDAARVSAGRLIDELNPQRHPERVTAVAFHLPVHVIARLLGLEPDSLDHIVVHVERFIRVLAPDATPEDRLRGVAAVETLIDELERAAGDGDLLAAFESHLLEAGEPDRAALIANAIGFMMQSYEATAGLTGNTLVALAREVGWQLDRAFVEEVARFDAPVQNTRRFVAEDGIVAGQSVRAGDAILVLLAAANRDPAANPSPDVFVPLRRNPKSYTFGTGRHSCPASIVATTIALEGVRALVAAGCSPKALASRLTYRAAPNVRIPEFHA